MVYVKVEGRLKAIAPVVGLMLVTAILASINLVIIVSGAPNATSPSFHFASIKLSNEAVQLRQNLTSSISDASSPAILLYVNSYCTTDFKAGTYSTATDSKNNNSQAVLNYSNLKCYNYSQGYWYDFEYEFGMNATCAQSNQDDFKSTSIRVSQMYLTAVILTFFLLLCELYNLLSKNYVRMWFRCFSFALAIIVFGLNAGSLVIIDSYKPMEKAFHSCFEPAVTVNSLGKGRVVVTIIALITSFVVMIMSIYILCHRDVRPRKPSATKLPSSYDNSGGDGGGGYDGGYSHGHGGGGDGGGGDGGAGGDGG